MASALEATYQSIYTGEEIDKGITDINTHIVDEERHITSDERLKWNSFALGGSNKNGIFRGANLDELWSTSGAATVERLGQETEADGFGDIFLGDYFTIAINPLLPDGTQKPEDVPLMVGGFDYYFNTGNTALTKHHIILIPMKGGFANPAKMNDEATTDGGYLNSYMHQTVLPCYAAALKDVLGEHMLSHKELLTNKVTDGKSSGWIWTDVDLCLMNEVQVYGAVAFGSSGFDVGNACYSLPVFRFANKNYHERKNIWLRSVVDTNEYARYGKDGNASYAESNSENSVCPIIVFG